MRLAAKLFSCGLLVATGCRNEDVVLVVAEQREPPLDVERASLQSDAFDDLDESSAPRSDASDDASAESAPAESNDVGLEGVPPDQTDEPVMGLPAPDDELDEAPPSEPSETSPSETSPSGDAPSEDDDGSKSDDPVIEEPSGDDPIEEADEPPSLRDWCAEQGIDPLDAFEIAIDIGFTYYAVQQLDCTTAGLTRNLTAAQDEAWLNYLIDYSYLMTGCPLPWEPPLGGALAFGPANLAAVGAKRSSLGPDDAENLIEQFTGIFADYLGLADDHRSATRAYLWYTAESEIDEGLSATLSICESEVSDE